MDEQVQGTEMEEKEVVKSQESKKESKEEKESVKTVDIEVLKKELTEQIAEKVRREEKDKLYPEIDKYK